MLALFAHYREVVDFQIYVDVVPGLLEVQRVVLSSFGRVLHRNRGNRWRRSSSDLALDLVRQDCVLHSQVRVQMPLHFCDPGVFKYFLKIEPSFWVELENSSDEFLDRGGEMAGEVIISLEHGLPDLLCTFPFEGGMAVQHFVEQNSQSPDIDSVVVLRFEQHFRSHILIGTAEGGPLGFDVLRTPAEVTDADVAHGIEQQVLWLSQGKVTLRSLWMMS